MPEPPAVPTSDGPYLRAIRQAQDAYPDPVVIPMTGRGVALLRKRLEGRPEVVEVTYRAGHARLVYVGRRARY